MTVLKRLHKPTSAVFAFLMLFSATLGMRVFAETNTGYSGQYRDVTVTDDEQPFAYIHDPSENPEAMKDVVKDESAVYGYRPSETGSLKAYADADWSDPVIVEKGRQERIAYHESIASMYDLLRQMQDEGKSVEEIARAVSTRRNELRMESYKDDPEGLELLKQRNLEKYGHEEGPLPDELFDQYTSWQRVIEKAFSANVGMDVCLGLYDDYYDLYVILGQVGEQPPTGMSAGIEQWIILMSISAAAAAGMIVISRLQSKAYTQKYRKQ